MGKLTRKEAEDLHKIGTLDDETMEVLENEGFVARRARGQRRVTKTKNNSYVTLSSIFVDCLKMENTVKRWKNFILKSTNSLTNIQQHSIIISKDI